MDGSTVDPCEHSPFEALDFKIEKVVKRGIPPWLIPVGCLGVFVCLVFCGVAVGYWVYLIRSGYVFEKTPDSAAPSFPPSPNVGNFGPIIKEQVPNGRLVEAEGGFSYVPPQGWMASKIPGVKYRLLSGPQEEGDSPNIVAADEEFAGSLEDYVKANLSHLRASIEGFHLKKQEDFRTTSELAGIRALAEVQGIGRRLRQTYYFFAKENTKYIVICTARSEEGEKYDPIFEACMKTFRLDR